MNNPLPSMLAAATLSLAVCLPFQSTRAAEDLNSDYPLVGTWLGSIQAGKFSFAIAFNFEEGADGSILSTMDQPDFGRKGLPVAAVLYNHPSVLVEVDGMGGVFMGRLEDDFERIRGRWTLAGGRGPKMEETVFVRQSGESGTKSVLDFTFDPARPDLRGYWKGIFKPAPEVSLTMILKIGAAEEGAFQGALDVVEQGARDLPMSSIDYTRPDAVLKWNVLNAEIQAALNDDGTKLAGNWMQGGRSMPIEFDRLASLEDATSGSASLSYQPPADRPDIRGYWEGVLEIQTARLRMELAIGQAADGTFQGTLDVVDQGAKGIPMNDVAYEAPSVKLEWKALGASYEGTLNEAGDEMSGAFKQGPLEADLKFRRKGD